MASCQQLARSERHSPDIVGKLRRLHSTTLSLLPRCALFFDTSAPWGRPPERPSKRQAREGCGRSSTSVEGRDELGKSRKIVSHFFTVLKVRDPRSSTVAAIHSSGRSLIHNSLFLPLAPLPGWICTASKRLRPGQLRQRRQQQQLLPTFCRRLR